MYPDRGRGAADRRQHRAAAGAAWEGRARVSPKLAGARRQSGTRDAAARSLQCPEGHFRNGNQRMLIRRIALVALAIFVALISDSAQSQQRRSQPDTKPQQTQQPTSTDQRGTEQSPAFVKIIPAPKSAAEATQESEDRQDKKDADTWMIRWTGAVAVFTLVLAAIGAWQGIQLKRTVDLAREEFIATHRPKIRIHVAEFKHIPDNYPDESQNKAAASLLCFNIGESVAKKVEVRGQFFCGSNFSVDVQRPVIKEFEAIKSGEKFRVETASDWAAVDVAAAPRQGIELYLVGTISYWDENELRRETAFCFRAQFGARDRWVSAEKPEYEYEY
jgi:hypothetical protein